MCAVDDFKSITFYEKKPILYAYKIAPNNVLCHHKRLMGYLEFLDGSRIICFPLNIPKKLHGQHLFEKPEDPETHRLSLS